MHKALRVLLVSLTVTGCMATVDAPGDIEGDESAIIFGEDLEVPPVNEPMPIDAPFEELCLTNGFCALKVTQFAENHRGTRLDYVFRERDRPAVESVLKSVTANSSDAVRTRGSACSS